MRTPALRSLPLRAALPAAALVAVLAAPAPARAAEDVRVAPRGQDVTIIEGEERTVYEYRQNGELRMVRIVPAVGPAYWLVPADDTEGHGNLERADMLLPQWRLIEF